MFYTNISYFDLTKTVKSMKNKTLNTLILSLAIVLMASTAFSQALFQNTYSSSTNLKPMFSGPASGSGIIMCGATDATPSDGFVSKTDLNGVVQWTKKIGGSQEDVINVVRPTADGGYIAVGYTKSAGAGDMDALLVKLDASGNISWSKTYGTTTIDVGNDVVQTSDGGYAAIGYARHEYAITDKGGFYVFKTNSSGTLSWSKMWGVDGQINGMAIMQAANGSLICSGTGWGGILIVQEVSQVGVLNWASGTTLYSQNITDKKVKTLQLSDGGFITLCNTMSSNGNQSFILMRSNTTGIKIWSNKYHNSTGFSDDTYGGIVKTWGGFLIAGNCEENGGAYTSRPTMIRIDTAGNVQSARQYTALPYSPDSDYGFGIEKLSDGTHATVSYYANKILLIKSNWSGAMGCTNNLISISKNSASVDNGPMGSAWTSVGTTIVNTASLTSTSLSLTKTTLCSTAVGIETTTQSTDIKVFPNPFTNKFEIDLTKEYKDVEITIYDVLSHIIYTNKYQSTNKITISRNNMASGVYFYQIKSDNLIVAKGRVVAE